METRKQINATCLVLAILCLVAIKTTLAGYKHPKLYQLGKNPQPERQTRGLRPTDQLDRLINELFKGDGAPTSAEKIGEAIKTTSNLLSQGVAADSPDPVFHRTVAKKVKILRDHCDSEGELKCHMSDLNRLNELSMVEGDSLSLSVYVLDCKRKILAACVDQVVEETERQIEGLRDASVQMLDNLAELMEPRKNQIARTVKVVGNLPLDRYYYVLANLLEDLSGEAIKNAASKWLGGKSAYEREFNRLIYDSCVQINEKMDPNLCLFDPKVINTDHKLLAKSLPLINWCASGKHCFVIQEYRDEILEGSFNVVKSRLPRWFGKE